MSFGKFIFVMFLPPIYLYTRGKVISGTLSLILWLLAWGMLISLIAAIVSPIPYLLSLLPAMWAFKREMFDRQSSILAQKMANAVTAAQQK